MANRYFKDHIKTLEGGIIKLFGKVVTTTSGTIGSQSCKGFSVAKTAAETGRYTVTLEDKYQELMGLSVTVEGAADAAYTDAAGVAHIVRGVAVGASTPLFYLQFIDPTDSSDAEVADAAEFYIEISLKNTTAY